MAKKTGKSAFVALVFLAAPIAYVVLSPRGASPPRAVTPGATAGSKRPAARLGDGGLGEPRASFDRARAEPHRSGVEPEGPGPELVGEPEPVTDDPALHSSPPAPSAPEAKLEPVLAPAAAETPDPALASLSDKEMEEYRRLEELAFRTVDEEEEKKELTSISQSVAMAQQQEQATALVIEEARTAVSQQQQTFRRSLPELDAKERLNALAKLAVFRNQYIFDRLKSILNPDQLNYYQDYVAQQQFEAQSQKPPAE